MTSQSRLSLSPDGSPANRKHFYDYAPLVRGRNPVDSFNKWLYADTLLDGKVKLDGAIVCSLPTAVHGHGDGQWLQSSIGMVGRSNRKALTPKKDKNVNRKEDGVGLEDDTELKIKYNHLGESTNLKLAFEMISVDVLGSYNWDTGDWRATIVVPGAPKIFQPIRVNSRLREQDKQMLVDEDSYRCPQAPLEPLLVAVKLLSPKLDFGEMDIVGDLTCIKKLVRYLITTDPMETEVDFGSLKRRLSVNNDQVAQHDKSAFRIQAQLINHASPGCKTVALMRRENNHYIRWYGYGAGAVQSCQEVPGDPLLHGPHKQIYSVRIGNVNLMLRNKVLMANYAPVFEEGGHIERIEGSTMQVQHAGIDPRKAQAVLICSLSAKKMSISVDKWIEMLLTNNHSMYLVRHDLGRVVSGSWIDMDEVQRLCKVKYPHRLLRRLEHLLTTIAKVVRDGKLYPGYALILCSEGLCMYPLSKCDHQPASPKLITSLFDSNNV